jgi:hypothetical protein
MNLIVVRAAYDPDAKVWWVEDIRHSLHHALACFGFPWWARYLSHIQLFFTVYRFFIVLDALTSGDASVMPSRRWLASAATGGGMASAPKRAYGLPTASRGPSICELS